MLASVLHTVIIYAVVIFAMRLMGKRLGQVFGVNFLVYQQRQQRAVLLPSALTSRICLCFPAWCRFY